MPLRALFLSLCLTGLLAAQTPAPAPNPGGRGQRGPGGFGRGPGGPGGPISERRLTERLGLNAEQQNAVHTAILSDEVQRKGMNQQSAELRIRLAAAVKSGDEGTIDQVTRDIATLHQQDTAIRAKTISKIYGSLTSEQKAKFEPEMNRSLGVPMLRNGGTPGAPGPRGRGPRPAPPAQQ